MNVVQLVGSWGPWKCHVYRDTNCLNHRSYGPIRVFLASVSWWSEGLFDLSFSVVPPFRHLKGSPGWGSSLLFDTSGTLKGQPQLFSSQCWQCEERSYSDGPTPYMWLFSIALTPWLPIFLRRHFPLQFSPSGPLGPCLHSQQQTSPWDCSTIPMFQLPATVPSKGPVSLSRVHMAAVRIICVIFIPFRLSHISCFTLSFKCFSSVPKNCPDGRDQTPAPFPLPTKGRSSSTNSPLFSLYFLFPTKFCVILYILFWWSGTAAHSQRVFWKLFCV